MAMTPVAESVLPARNLILNTTGRGASSDAVHLRRLLKELWDAFSDPSITLTSRVTEAALTDAYRQAQTDNWDGYGAKAVTPDQYEWAKLFVSLLPTTAPPAEASADPDGELSLEWRTGPWRTFSVSIGPGGRLTYAGLFGRRARSHGTEYFVSEIPKAITINLRRLVAETEV